MFTSTFTVIYGKIVAATFGREAGGRGTERDERGAKRSTATFKRAGCAAKNSKGFDHLSRHGLGGKRNRPDGLIVD